MHYSATDKDTHEHPVLLREPNEVAIDDDRACSIEGLHALRCVACARPLLADEDVIHVHGVGPTCSQLCAVAARRK